MTDFPVTIFHNPRCGTSRNVLAMIEAAGYAPTVVSYVETGWTREQLRGLLAAMGARPADILRAKEPAAQALGPDADDEAILEAMIAEPTLVQRPIVVTPKGARMCRPSEAVFDLLERRPAIFTKEDGEVV
jgi:arsenate reductase